MAQIEELGKLTPELRKQILEALDMQTLEDLYLPYKPKRRTKATIAKELGLEPLAKKIMQQLSVGVNDLVQPFINDQVTDAEMALQGARDIIAEWINENQYDRKRMRNLFQNTAYIFSKLIKGKDEEIMTHNLLKNILESF